MIVLNWDTLSKKKNEKKDLVKDKKDGVVTNFDVKRITDPFYNRVERLESQWQQYKNEIIRETENMINEKLKTMLPAHRFGTRGDFIPLRETKSDLTIEQMNTVKDFVITQVQSQLSNWNIVFNEIQNEIKKINSTEKDSESMIRSEQKINEIKSDIFNLKSEYSKIYKKNIQSSNDLENVKNEIEKITFNQEKQEKEMITRQAEQKRDLLAIQQELDKIVKKIALFDDKNPEVQQILKETQKNQKQFEVIYDKLSSTDSNLDHIFKDLEKFKQQFSTINQQIITLNRKEFRDVSLCMKEEIEKLEEKIEQEISKKLDVMKNDLFQFDDVNEKWEEWKKQLESSQFETWRMFRQQVEEQQKELQNEIEKVKNEADEKINVTRNELLDFLGKTDGNLIDLSDDFGVFKKETKAKLFDMENWKSEVESKMAQKWNDNKAVLTQYISNIDERLNSIENRLNLVEQACEELKKDVNNQDEKILESNKKTDNLYDSVLRVIEGNVYLGNVEIGEKDNLVTKISNIYANPQPIVDSPMMVFCDNKGQLGTNFSSIKFKENVDNIGEVSKSIYKLRPVSFTYKQDENKNLQYGLIGEEVEKVLPELVCYNKEDNVIGVAYHKIVPLLLNEMKTLKKELEQIKLKN